MPLISVIIPMRNAEPYVRAAVESVLNQACADLEVIVIDDGSTDQSAHIVRSIGDPRVRIIPGPQKGIAASFNAGLAEAKGELLARCDADDIYSPARLAYQLEFLKTHPEAGAVCGLVSMMTHRGKVIGSQQGSGDVITDVTDDLRQGRGQSHMCAYLFRTEILRRIGGCREFFVTAEDADLQFRLSEATGVWYLPREAYRYRLHDSSITHVQRAAERAFYEKCARDFQQQRLRHGKDDLDLGQPPLPPQVDRSAPVSSRQQIQRLLLGQAWAAHGSGRKCEGISLGLRAWMTNPFRLFTARSVIALVFKRPGMKHAGTKHAAAIVPHKV